MTNIDKEKEQKEKAQEEENKQTQKQTPDIADFSEREARYHVLRQKYLLQNEIKKLKPEDREKLEKGYNETYEGKFGELEMDDGEKQEYKTLKNEIEPEQAKRGRESIANLQHELIKAPPASKFEGFRKGTPEDSSEKLGPTEEYVRIAIGALPTEMVALFNEFFVVRFQSADWSDPSTPEGKKNNQLLSSMSGGALVEKFQESISGKTKFRINVDLDTFYEDYEETLEGKKYEMQRFNRNKFLYTICRAILATIKNKTDFEKFLKKEEKLGGKHIDSNCKHGYDDWLATFFANPEAAKNLNPELAAAATKWLKESFAKGDMIKPDDAPSHIVIDPLRINQKQFQKKQYWKNAAGDKIESPGWKTFFNIFGAFGATGVANAIYGFADYVGSIKLAFEQEILMSKTEEYEKEVKRLLSRDLGGGDYQKLMRLPQYWNDKDRMRALIMVIAKKNAYHWQYGQIWLWKWDPVFKRTQGKEVGVEGFDFIAKIDKLAGSENKVAGTVNYKQIGNRFMRMSYAAQLGRYNAIFDTFSLKDIQRAKPDIFNNLFCENTGFLNLDAKLGSAKINAGKTDKAMSKTFLGNQDIDLSKILPKGWGDRFVNDMHNYEKATGDEGFNRLMDPVAVAMIEKYAQESLREPQLFNMYTSPMVRKAFEYYKNFVDEPEYAKREYDHDQKEMMDDMKEHDNNPEEILTHKSYEDLSLLYKDFYKEKREYPYAKGRLVTKFGKIRERVHQGHDKVEMYLRDLASMTDDSKNWLRTKLNKFSVSESILVEDIDKFNSSLEKILSSMEYKDSQVVRAQVNDYMKVLENYGIIRAYQSIFRPYDREVAKYSEKGGKGQKQGKNVEEHRKWFMLELMSENSSITQKISDIENHTQGLVSFSSSERETLSSKDKFAGFALLTKLFNEKLGRAGVSKDKMFSNDYQELNALYFNVNQAMLYPEEFKAEIPGYIQKFQSLGMIPDEAKRGVISDLRELQSKLTLSKVVADDYYEEKIQAQQKRYGFGMVSSFDEEYEYDMELEEMEQANK